MRTLRIVGSGNYADTQVFDAETGENISLDLGIFRIEYKIGPDAADSASAAHSATIPK